MKQLIMLVAVALLSVDVGSAAVVSTDAFVGVGGQGHFTIDFVTISGATNPASGYGIVEGAYRMGMLEITNDQFAMFASSSPYYAGADIPANTISWYEAVQFVNYLNTSTGHDAAYRFSGDVMVVWQDGDDGYDEGNPFRNSNAKYFLPTENEWVKAAYWNGTSLQTYATTDGSSPRPGIHGNFNGGDGPWNVGSGMEELNGTFDMMGNVWELMEDGVMRGGSCDYLHEDYISSSIRIDAPDPYGKHHEIGFRVASVVPEPSSLVLLTLGGLMLRRRRRARLSTGPRAGALPMVLAAAFLICLAAVQPCSGQSPAVAIPDPGLQQAINEALGKPAGSPLTRAELENLISLTLRGRIVTSDDGDDDLYIDITHLDGLQYATGLESLVLEPARPTDSRHRVRDLGPIKGLTRLRKLRIDGSHIRDLTPLTGLQQLEELDLKEASVRSLRPLTALQNLRELDLKENRVRDLAPLASLPGLVRLDLDRNQVSDLGPLAGMSSLKRLELEWNPISDLSPLAGLTDLERLDLDHCEGISDLTGLEALLRLKELDLDGNEISNLGPLSTLVNLRSLDLRENRITDLTPLADLFQLVELRLDRNAIENLAPLYQQRQPLAITLDHNRLDAPAGSINAGVIAWWEASGSAVHFGDQYLDDPGSIVPDGVLRAAIRAQLNIFDRPLTAPDLQQLGRLYISGLPQSGASPGCNMPAIWTRSGASEPSWATSRHSASCHRSPR